MSEPMDVNSGPSTLFPCQLSQDSMLIDIPNLRGHVIMAHGTSVATTPTSAKSALEPVSTINLRTSYKNVIVIMNCRPIPQKMPTCMRTLWQRLNSFYKDITSIPLIVKNIDDIYFTEHERRNDAGLCYFFDRCPNITLNAEKCRWRDGVYQLPVAEFNDPNIDFSIPNTIDMNRLSQFPDLQKYVDYVSCRYRHELNIIIVFACTNQVSQGKIGYHDDKLKYCRVFPAQQETVNSQAIMNIILKKANDAKLSGGSPTIYILGRKRRIYIRGKKEYIRYKNELITIKQAEKIKQK